MKTRPGRIRNCGAAPGFCCFQLEWKTGKNMDEKMEICQGMGPKREKIFHFSFKMRKFRENWMKEESRKNEKKESSKVTKNNRA
ncbi:hypothetical protein [Allofournierella massiliensis]|uniref:Uncharacterized protein n=1 Tax=Allofournierella massiliensis TaxID=1650663 RepID=A0ABT7UT30_9FIRM|nr:hypothetical protein [Fournierella massiliensis]MDM8202051.1 hypothetical protein [Fournierella massiliensis]